jgi:hypothetical protein
MDNKSLRIVIDTNIIVRAVSSGSLSSSIFDAFFPKIKVLKFRAFKELLFTMR